MLAVFDLGGLLLRIVRVVYLVIQKLWIKKKRNFPPCEIWLGEFGVQIMAVLCVRHIW